MAVRLDKKLVIGISSRALFDLSYENELFEREGYKSYSKYQIEHENDVLKPGSGFALVKALLKLNNYEETKDLVEVIVMSRNSADASLRVFNSIKHYGLDITRGVLTSGRHLSDYLSAFNIDLFLSAYEDDVQKAIDSNFAAGLIYTDSNVEYDTDNIDQIRIAFDGDAVLFSDESEMIFKSQGMQAFVDNEVANANKELPEGPFANLLKTIAGIQQRFDLDDCPIRTAIVTARSAPAHERVIRTLRAWNVRVDEAFFLGGMRKKEFLQAFGANIFFDDQATHLDPASKAVPSAQVPYRSK
ncbi:MAG: 5'-nucleotidase [Erysipelotrichales bacterium]|nr:5'-nucleotidase [Erysipelotrichales bacterium]